jgi:hypothetical protein
VRLRIEEGGCAFGLFGERVDSGAGRSIQGWTLGPRNERSEEGLCRTNRPPKHCNGQCAFVSAEW